MKTRILARIAARNRPYDGRKSAGRRANSGKVQKKSASLVKLEKSIAKNLKKLHQLLDAAKTERIQKIL